MNKILHSYIYDDLLENILEGHFENNMLPSEIELQKRYGVSRITVRRAIQDLQNNGYVLKTPGIGTIIKSNKIIIDLQTLTSFSKEALKTGIVYHSILIDFKIITAPKKVIHALNLLKNEKVYYLERIRLLNNKKIGVQVSYIVMSKGIKLYEDEFKNKNTSLYNLLEKQNINLTFAEENIEALMPNEDIKKKLELPENQPIFYRERITKDETGTSIEYAEMYYRTDEYKYNIKCQIK